MTRYSANAPLRFTPTPLASLQFSLCPSRQLRHFPHVICPSPDTRSPMLNPRTPSPVSTTSPTYSWPAVRPMGIVCCAQSFHCQICTSVPQIAVLWILIFTSFGPTSGMGTRFIQSPSSGFSLTSAHISPSFFPSPMIYIPPYSINYCPIFIEIFYKK